jgi:ABC-2 type transport system ATP-binding protein
MPDDTVAVMESVVKRFGAARALAGISLAVRRGEMFGLIGPDGAGKTTAIRLLCGLIRADEGTVRVLGLDPVADHRRLTASVGYLSQRFSLYGDLSVDENVAFFAEIHGLRDYGARRARLLDITRLTPFRDRLADRLSGGMKQKLALACTLVHEPALILLDEPTTGVDPVSRREFWMLLSEFLAEGVTIVMATPYLDEAERCGRIALLHHGAALAIERPDVLRAAAGTVIEIVTGERGALERVAALPGIADAQIFGDRAHVRLADDTARAAADPAGLARLRERWAAREPSLVSVRPVPASLEDVFVSMISHA